MAVNIVERARSADQWVLDRHERTLVYLWDNYGVSRSWAMRATAATSVICAFLDRVDFTDKWIMAFGTAFLLTIEEWYASSLGDETNNTRIYASRNFTQVVRLCCLVFLAQYFVTMAVFGNLRALDLAGSVLNMSFLYVIGSRAPTHPPRRKKEEEKLAWQPSL